MRTGENMKPLSTTKRNILFYGVYGFLLGLISPVIGILYELIPSGTRISLSSLKTIHMQELLLLIIDMAPLVIATFAALVGLQSARLLRWRNEPGWANVCQQSEKKKRLAKFAWTCFESWFPGSMIMIDEVTVYKREIHRSKLAWSGTG